ncbi:MAG: iron chelate uptake ABC transporter family permease subunit [Planctomycetota bacterium]
MEMLDLLVWPFAACLVLTGIHCYLGIHVVTRGVIFVDLALAQIAALGTTVGLLLGCELHSYGTYAISVLFTFAGAAVFSLSRFRDERIPQEAIIGIVYAVSSATAVLVLDKAPHGHEAIHAMLVGSVLYVTPMQVVKTLLIYSAVGVLHFMLRKKFLLISASPAEARRRGLYIRWWDFVFYITFGLVVTSSVAIAGVLLVFSYLVVPAVCAMLFVSRILPRLLIGWAVGFVVSVVGMYLSAQWDLPTGAAVVSTFGGALVVCTLVHAALCIVRADGGSKP